MKWQVACAVLAFLHSCAARGLKTPRVHEAASAVDSGLEAQNEELRKRNKHLEAMMQVARAEVQRMDALSAKKHVQVHSGSDGTDIEDLKKKLQAAEAEKKSLVQTLRKMLAKNSTKIFRTQAENAVQAKQALEMKCDKERIAFEDQIKASAEKCAESQELAQTLQEQNMDLQKTVRDLRAQLKKNEQKDKELSIDKQNLVATMHNLMRESSSYRKEVEKEMKKEKSLEEELAAKEAKIAKLTKAKTSHKEVQQTRSAPSQKAPVHLKLQKGNAPSDLKLAKGVKSGTHIAPMHLNHEESMASKMAKMKDINRYLDRADMPDIPADIDDSSDDTSVEENPQDIFTRGKLAVQPSSSSKGEAETAPHVAEAAPTHQAKGGVQDWLGLKAVQAKPDPVAAIPKDSNGLSPIDSLDPEAVQQEKAAQEKKEKEDADEGGDGVQQLLAQANEQLNAMDDAEAQDKQ